MSRSATGPPWFSCSTAVQEQIKNIGKRLCALKALAKQNPQAKAKLFAESVSYFRQSQDLLLKNDKRFINIKVSKHFIVANNCRGFDWIKS